MSSTDINSFFSIPIDILEVSEKSCFDIYVNASNSHVSRFVRMIKHEEPLTESDIKKFKQKFTHLYIPEIQRKDYLHELMNNSQATDFDKVSIIKNMNLRYLERIFTGEREFDSTLLNQILISCKETTEFLINIVQDYSMEKLHGLIAKLSFHDFYTFDHSVNVSMYNIAFYKKQRPQADQNELLHIGLSGLLHDLGKIQIPTKIINYPGKLNEDDFCLMKKHPIFGKKILLNEQIKCPHLNKEFISSVINEHHENYDGSGYPNQKKGKDISLFARITAISDFFDALTTQRSYHNVLNIEKAMHVMSSAAGEKIDPVMFSLFLKNTNVKLKKSHNTHVLKTDFDPCRPSNVLLIKKVENQTKLHFGKVKTK